MKLLMSKYCQGYLYGLNQSIYVSELHTLIGDK